MGGHRSTWRVRAFLEELDLSVVDLPAPDDVTHTDSVRHVDALLRSARPARDPVVRRAIEEIYLALRGSAALAAARGGARDVSTSRPIFERAIDRELRLAAYSGRLRATLVYRPPPEVRLPEVEAVLASLRPAPKPKDSWIGLRLVDQNGAPVPGRAFRVIAPDGSTIGGTLDATGSAMVENLDPGDCQVFCPYVAPHPELNYTMQPGDHVSAVAAQQGFDDYSVVWGHPNNSTLAGQRDVPHALSDGDQLYIPALRATPVSKPTELTHQFTLNVSPCKVRIQLLASDMTPAASATCTLGGTSLTSDGNGVVEIPIDKLAQSTTLVVDGNQLELTLGGLNDVGDTSAAGWKARLFNMGFLIDPGVADDDDELAFAIEDFQAEQSLDVSGTLDDATKSKIKDVYGC